MTVFTPHDPFDDLADEEGATEDEAEEMRLPTDDEWKYAFTPAATDHRAGREMYTAGEDEMYAGEVVRQMIEARRFRPDSYTWFGYTKDPNRGVEEVGVPHQSLFTHTMLFGASGYGKSTVMQNMMLQWMQANYGVCFIDPKGDDSEELLRSLPEHRRDDLLWVEPGNAERAQAVGFNFFDTYNEPGTSDHAEEAEQVADQFVELLEVFSRDWSPQMSGTAKAIVEQLVKADEEYTPIDFYTILDSAPERDAFLEMYGDSMEDIARNYVENFDPKVMQGLISQVEQMVGEPVLREMIAHEDSDVSLAECVEEGKIILANISNLSDDSDKKLVTAAFVRRIWSTINARSGEDETELSPFYLAIDELKDVTKNLEDEDDKLQLGEIISKARSLRLSLMMATQQPSQLTEDVKKEVYACQNMFTFNPDEMMDAGEVGKAMDVDGMTVMNLDKFTVLGQVTIEGSKSDPLLIHTFPKYPPLRSEEEALKLVEESIANYGAPRKRGSFDLNSHGVERYQDEHEATSVTTDAVELTPDHVLAALASAQEYEDCESFHGYDDWVIADSIESLVHRHAPNIDFDDVTRNIIRPLTGQSIEQHEEQTSEYFRLTQSGRDTIYTGTTGGVEGDLALAALRYLSDLGEQVTLPLDSRESAFFHATAQPPIKPTAQADIMEEADTLHMALQTSYPDLAEHFQDHEVMVMANSNPNDRVREFATALAMRKNRHIVFVIPEHASAAATPSAISPAEFAADVLTADETAPAFLKSIDDEGYRTFYTSHRAIEPEENTRAVAQSSGTWCERGDDCHLAYVDANGNELTTFADLEAIQYDADPDQFPYHCKHDPDTGEWVLRDTAPEPVTDDDGNVRTDDDGNPLMEDSDDIQRYDSLDALEADGYTIIQEPFVPESILPSETPNPDPSTWTLLVVPETGDPYFYSDTGETDVSQPPAPEDQSIPDTPASKDDSPVSFPSPDSDELSSPSDDDATDENNDTTNVDDIDNSKWEFSNRGDEEDTDSGGDGDDNDVEDPFGTV